jgi:hypothetical protein
VDGQPVALQESWLPYGLVPVLAREARWSAGDYWVSGDLGDEFLAQQRHPTRMNAPSARPGERADIGACIQMKPVGRP